MRPEPTSSEGLAESRWPCVVGLGASAGGLEALESFFQQMRTDCGLAFVVIQHLSPDFRSLMDELLSRHTKMSIHRVTDGMRIEPNAVYLIPPKKEMVIEEGRLRLLDKDPHGGLNLPIDTFFRSLAKDLGDRAIAVVLSGTGSDGSRGLQDVHEAGGLVIVQSPDSAKFDGMPRSALDTGVVDLVLAPGEIPEAIERYVSHPSDPPSGKLGETPPEGIDAIRSLLRREYGLDFSNYKPATIHRRIERRLLISGITTLSGYVDLLSSNRDELHALYKDLLIGVTRFFRDEEAFRLLEKKVLPVLCAERDADEELRFWVVGCATGEEAYSIAMIVNEYLESTTRPLKVKIFATDVHRASLEYASAGCYSAARLGDLSAERIARHFHRTGSDYRVNTAIRELIVFAPHNVLRDAPFTRIDLVTCRNLLIYFQPAAQKKAMALFHFALQTGGFMFLGPSETPGEVQDEFETISTRWKIFKKIRDGRLPPEIRIPVTASPPVFRSTPPRSSPPDRRREAANSALFEHFAPPSLLINDRYELLHTYAGGGKYLAVPDGEPVKNILEMVPHEMKLALTGALQRAQKEQHPAIYSGVNLPDPQSDAILNCKLTVMPVRIPELNETCFLIAIEPRNFGGSGDEGEPLDISQATRQQIESLEEELQYTKENLQATLEEMETANEELQATNEELVASNEELQSTNEELHSVNEELYTVNAEYQRKIAELTELNNDMDNLLASTDVGTVFLDSSLRVRKFTPQAAPIFHLLPGDLGRPLAGFASTLLYPSLHEDLQFVLEKQERVERDVRDRDGRCLLVRILPYQDKTQETTGVVVSLVDITQLKSVEAGLRRMSTVFRDGADPIVIENLDGVIIDLNEEATRCYGYSREELIGKHYSVLVPEDYRDEARQLRSRCRQHEHVRNVEQVRRSKSGQRLPILLTLSVLPDEEGEPAALVTIAKDISRRKKAEDEARLAVVRRDEFLATLSHELRNPLAAVLNAQRIIRERHHEPEVVSEASQVAFRQASQMARLLDDLLDVSRVVKGKIELKRQVTDLRRVAQDAVDALQPAIQAHRHHLKMDLPGQPVNVDGDPTRLLQIVENLVSNATKYTPAGGQLQVEIFEENSQAVIQVSDNGDGIPAEMLPTIFEPFTQVNATIDRSDGGMGVGLTLVRSLVELHEGDVAVESSEEGTRFTVRLRSTKQPVADRPPANAPRKKLAETFRRIVVVEDNEDSRNTLAMLLRLEGFEVQTAPDGLQGYEMIAADPPDVSLIDIGLPGLDGYELARRIRSDEQAQGHTKRARLVALSGYGREEDRKAAIRAGFSAHLVKPLDPAQLYNLLDRFRRESDG